MEWFVNYVLITTICGLYHVSARSHGVKRHNVCEDVPLKTVKIIEDSDSCGKFIACIGQFAEHYKCLSDGVYGNGTIECLACDMDESLVNLDENATTTTKKKIIVRDTRPTRAFNRKSNGKTLKPRPGKNSQNSNNPEQPDDNEPMEYDEDLDDSSPRFIDEIETTEVPNISQNNKEENLGETTKNSVELEEVTESQNSNEEKTKESQSFEILEEETSESPLDPKIDHIKLEQIPSHNNDPIKDEIIETIQTTENSNDDEIQETSPKILETSSENEHPFQLPSESNDLIEDDTTYPLEDTTKALHHSTTSTYNSAIESSKENELEEIPSEPDLSNENSIEESTSEMVETTSENQLKLTSDERNISENLIEETSSVDELLPQPPDTQEMSVISSEELNIENVSTENPQSSNSNENSNEIMVSDIESTEKQSDEISEGDVTTESTVFPGHHPLSTSSESTVRDQSSNENSLEISNDESTQTFPHPSSITSEEIINERTTSATINESAESTSYSSDESHESSSTTSQFSPSETITDGTVLVEHNEEVSETASIQHSTHVHHDETTDYDYDATTGTCFTFPDYNSEEDVELEESYTTPIIRFHKANSESSSVTREDEKLIMSQAESTTESEEITEETQYHIRTLPPDHYNSNDPYMQKSNENEEVLHDGDILGEGAFLEKTESSLNPNSSKSTENATTLSSHHIRTLPPDHFNPNDHFINHLPENSDEEFHKVHIFHTESPSNENFGHDSFTDESMQSQSNIQNELYASSENSLDDEQKHSDEEQKQHELAESSPHDSMENENLVDQNEDDIKSVDEKLENENISAHSDEHHADDQNIDSYENEILNTQNEMHSDKVDNEIELNENAIDPDNNPETDEHLTTEFSDSHVDELSTTSYPSTTKSKKRRKIRKSRTVSTTTPMTSNYE